MANKLKHIHMYKKCWIWYTAQQCPA